MLKNAYKLLLLASLAVPSAAASPEMKFLESERPESGDLAVFVGPDLELSALATEIDNTLSNRLSAALASEAFDGAFGSLIEFRAMAPFDTVSVIGIGDEALTPRKLADLGGYAAMANDADGIALIADDIASDIAGAGAYLANGYALGILLKNSLLISADLPIR